MHEYLKKFDSNYLEEVASMSDFSQRLSFLNCDSESSSSSSSNRTSLITLANFLSSSALWKQSLLLASTISFLQIESLLDKVDAFPNIQRQYLHNKKKTNELGLPPVWNPHINIRIQK